MRKEKGDLSEKLNDFVPEARRRTLERMTRENVAFPPAGGNVNMHFHSFFSYNAEGYSPSRIAWESRNAGLYAAGLCDFDVLDGLEEFLDAGRLLGLRTSVSLETRAYLKEYAQSDINSPGEPGVTYIMGAGFSRMPQPGTPQAAGQAGYRDRAQRRNLAVLERVNPHMGEAAISYEKDVLPLTPGGSATERHIVSAYVHKAISAFEGPARVAAFWAARLGKPEEEILDLMADRPSFEELVRSKLVKKGGVGYEQPSAGTFPPVEEFIRWVLSCDAIPMVTWLDGTSAGEADGRAMLECMVSKGCAALNIVPDRNWNIQDPKKREVKVAKLREIVQEAVKMALPINIGTEMNKQGLPFVDDLSGEALRPHGDVFLDGARVMVGQTLLARYAGFSYVSAAALAELKDRKARNAFFGAVGALPPLDMRRDAELNQMGTEKALAWFRDEVRRR